MHHKKIISVPVYRKIHLQKINFSLLLILFIILVTMASQVIVSSIKHSEYLTLRCCLISVFPCLKQKALLRLIITKIDTYFACHLQANHIYWKDLHLSAFQFQYRYTDKQDMHHQHRKNMTLYNSLCYVTKMY